MTTKQERMRAIDAVVFRTITSADWARALREARQAKNAVSAQIREKILALNLGKSESGNVSKGESEL